MRSATARPTPSSFCRSLAEAVLMLILSCVSPTVALAANDSVTTAAGVGAPASAAKSVRVTIRCAMRVSRVSVHCALEEFRARPLHGAWSKPSMCNVLDVASRTRTLRLYSRPCVHVDDGDKETRDAERLQGVRDARQCGGPRRRGRHWRGIWRDRDVVRE